MSDPTRKNVDRMADVITWLCIFLLCYVAVSFMSFRVRNPWLTETQVLQHTTDALMWRTLRKP